MFGVNTSLIRFWENEFDLLKPSKTKKGNRLFTTQDIENIKLIFKLVKGEGYTLQGAKEKLKMANLQVEEDKKSDRKIQKSNKEVLERLHHIKMWLEFLEKEI